MVSYKKHLTENVPQNRRSFYRHKALMKKHNINSIETNVNVIINNNNSFLLILKI